MAKIFINRGDIVWTDGLRDRALVEHSNGTAADLPVPEPDPDPEPEPDPEPDIPVVDPEKAPDVDPDPPEEQKKEYTCTNAKQGTTQFGLVRYKTKNDDDVCLKHWHVGFKRCIDFAVKNELPFVMVWSNGPACGHCQTLEKACVNSTFVNYMKNQMHVVWCWIESSDSDGKYPESKAFEFAGGKAYGKYRTSDKSQTYGGFPYVTYFWRKTVTSNGSKKKKNLIDFRCAGDVVDGGKEGKAGANNFIKHLKSKLLPVLTKYNYDPKA